MPSFSVQVPNLQATGPVVELQIAIGTSLEAVMRAAHTPIPPAITVLAMLDTGATRSVIRQGLAAQLGLNPVGVTHITTPSQTNVACYEYQIRLILPNNVTFEGVFLEAPLQGQHIQCLIGRDVLAHAVLVYIGYSNLFSLSF
jgi:hypothetical protein